MANFEKPKTIKLVISISTTKKENQKNNNMSINLTCPKILHGEYLLKGARIKLAFSLIL